MPKSRSEIIQDTVADLASKFMYYDRKEDEDLPVGAIEEALKAGEVSVDQLAGLFADAIRDSL